MRCTLYREISRVGNTSQSYSAVSTVQEEARELITRVLRADILLIIMSAIVTNLPMTGTANVNSIEGR